MVCEMDRRTACRLILAVPVSNVVSSPLLAGIPGRKAVYQGGTLVAPQARTEGIVSTSDPLAKRRRLDVSQLAGIRYISLSESTSSARQLQHLLIQQGAMPEVVATVDDFDTAHLLVELGLGHSIVPAVHAHSFVREKRVVAIPIRGAAFRVGWAARRFERSGIRT